MKTEFVFTSSILKKDQSETPPYSKPRIDLNAEMRTEQRGKGGHLSSPGLVLDVLRGADLGLDVLEVGQRLVDDAQLLGRGGGRLGRGAHHRHLPLVGDQAQGSRGAGPGGRRVAGRGSRGDGCGPRGARGGVAAAGRAGAHRFCD